MVEKLQHLPRDIGIYPAYDTICEPLNVSIKRECKWSIIDYLKAHKTYEKVKTVKL